MARPKNVVPFRLSESKARLLLVEIAADTSRVEFTPHARTQMRKRKITGAQVVNCLRKGVITEAPVLNFHGHWKLTIERYACGERIGCAVAIDLSAPRGIIITAFHVR